MDVLLHFPYRRMARLFLAILLGCSLISCAIPPDAPEEPWSEADFLGVEAIPPIYELLSPTPSTRHTLGLYASQEVVNARLTPSFREWEDPQEQDLYQTGQASWYGDKFHGRLTANGERYNMNKMTAAHRTLPFGTEVCVRSLLTSKEIKVRINDRGPFVDRRIIDLSRAAAERLGMLSQGLKNVALWIPDKDGPDCGDGDVSLIGKGVPAPRNP